MRLATLFSPAIAVMSSMRYPKKLALATVVFFLPFVLFLYLGYEQTNSESRSIQKLQAGLVYGQSVRRFFEYIPLQRGMTVAAQQGMDPYKEKVENNFKHIESAMAAVDTMPTPTASIAAEWKAIKTEHHTLQDGLWQRTAQENYKAHTIFIDKILLLMRHIGDASYTSRDTDLSVYHLVQILSDHIPALIQHTGRGRALGTLVILKQSISFDEKKEATILYADIRSNLDSVAHESTIACERHPQMCHIITPSVLAIREQTEKFSDLFTTQILNTDRSQISSERYFQDTTHTIDTYFKAYDTLSAALTSHLDDRLSHLNRLMVIGWLLALTVLACLVYFAIGFYLTFMGVLNELTGAASRISRGEYAARIPIKTHDEMADLSHSFNDMAKKIEQAFAFLESYKKAVDASNILSITDINGNITYVNDQFCLTTGYTREELMGKNHRILRDPLTPDDIYTVMWKTILDKKIWSGVLKDLSKNKDPYYVNSTIIPILDGDGEIVEFVATRHEITKLVNQKKQLMHQMYTDPLTGLSNRTKLLEDLALIKEPVLILVNIDRFGEINDFYGTKIGDEILSDMRDRIASGLLLDSCKQYRIYADEFAILCEKECFNHLSYKEIISSLHSHIESKPFCVNDSNMFIKVTIAAVSDSAAGAERTTATDLLTDADMVLRHAKLHEKEFVILHDIGTIKQEIAHNIEYIDKIRGAITENRIVPFFQGIIDNQAADTASVPTKYECLIRLIEPNGKVISPFFFLDVAKKAKLYPQLTIIMVDKTFSFFQNNECEFSINLSVEDILDPQIVGFILDKMEFSGIGRRVIFEILESEGFENFEEVQHFIGKVKQLGGRIAIDDFGSGYSNFAYILHLQVDFIKIDASLIKKIDKDINSRIVVETIVAFAKRLGIKTVAEFVYSKEVFEVVKEIGVDFSQGFYFHEPAAQL